MDEVGLAVIILVILIIALMIWDQRAYLKKELATQEIDIDNVSEKDISDIKQNSGTEAEFDKIFGAPDVESFADKPMMVPEEDLPKIDAKTWFRDLDPTKLRNKIELSEKSHDGKRLVDTLPIPEETGYFNPLAHVGSTETFY